MIQWEQEFLGDRLCDNHFQVVFDRLRINKHLTNWSKVIDMQDLSNGDELARTMGNVIEMKFKKSSSSHNFLNSSHQLLAPLRVGPQSGLPAGAQDPARFRPVSGLGKTWPGPGPSR
ncbi:ycf2-A Protein [Nymphaea thermarum]|nr:ycf2-A Protein [Nymphaea thermarum]